MIDWARVQELKDEVGEDDFAEVLELFFSEMDEALQGIEHLEGESLSRALHFIKGSALNIGLADLARMCRDAELAQTQPGQPPTDFAALRASLAACRSALEG